MAEFDGLRALITGAASGIGFEIVRQLVNVGAEVAALDREPERLDTLPPSVTYVCADIRDDTAVQAAVGAAATALGGLDILVNNAGMGVRGTILDGSDDDWLRVLDVNVVGTARVSRAAWPHLMASAHAAVVNTCSIAANTGIPERAIYSASKGAVLALTRAMAADAIADGIRVNAVSPGTVDTPWVARLLAEAPDPAAERRALQARQPHGRLVSVAEVAGAVLYLASPAAGSTTGVELPVDGGMAWLRLRSS